MINFGNNFFGKDLKEISLDDLIEYFSQPKTENDNLEFKSFPINTDFEKALIKILKTVCAFLNSSGGLIIWGAPVGNKPENSSEDVFQGELSPVTTLKGQDWFINKISSSISPMPKDIRVSVVTSGKAAIYIIEVQESQFKPHQFEHIYQIRLDGQNKPAPHYIVQALMREIKFPDIRAVIKFEKASKFNSGGIRLPIRIGIFNFSPYQNEFDINFRIVLVGAVFYNWSENLNNNVLYEMGGAGLRHKPFAQPLYYGMPHSMYYGLYLEKGIKELTVLLSFGGRQSPAKASTYKLDIANLDLENPNNSIVSLEENTLFQQKQSIDETISFFKLNNV